MKIAAVYDEEQDMVSITIGRPSYEISNKLKFMGAKMQPDSDYKLFHFQCTEEHPISYVQANLSKITSDNKWSLSLI